MSHHALARTQLSFNHAGDLVALDIHSTAEHRHERILFTKNQLAGKDLLSEAIKTIYEMGLNDAQLSFRDGLGRLLGRNL